MKKRDELIKKYHKSKISQHKDGRWRTYVSYQDPKRKPKLIAKKTKEDLLDAVYDFYNEEYNLKITFRQVAMMHFERKHKLLSANTAYRDMHDYKRFFEGTDFENLAITNIDEDIIFEFIIQRIKELDLLKAAYYGMWGHILNTFKFAFRKHMIDKNPMEYLERKDFTRLCRVNIKTAKQRTVSDEEAALILEQVEKDKAEKPGYMPIYAIPFAMLTGMRVGEIAGLMWSAIDYEERTITIDKAEVFNQITKEYDVAPHTKTWRIRVIPMTDDIEALLHEIRKEEQRYGYVGEYVFQNENGRLHTNIINTCIRNKCMQVGIKDIKSIHDFRRTVNSKLRQMGMSASEAASMLGHSELVNIQNYTYDIGDMDEKRRALAAINKKNRSKIVL